MNDYYSEIVSLASSKPHEEICGFLLNNGEAGLAPYVTANVSPENRAESFEISVDDQKLFYATGRVEAIFHSHPTGGCQFSKDDIQTSESSELPIFVYALKTDEFNLYVPKVKRQQYYDRKFIAGLRDCYQLAADYLLSHCGAELPYFRRTTMQLNNGVPNWAELAVCAGLKEVADANGLLKHDLLLLSLGNDQKLNHLAIYIGDGLILHQLLGSTSKITTLTSTWKRHIKRVFRA